MSQLNIYVPSELENRLRKRARQSKMSLSKFLSSLLENQMGQRKGWSAHFFTQTAGGWKGEMPSIERLPVEDKRDPL